MAVYSVEGKLGTGKTKFVVWRAQQALLEGKRVAGNIDLCLEHLVPSITTATYTRIPDKPKASDLYAIGHGNKNSYDEEKNGVLILDELGSWLNSRTYQEKGRQDVIDWMIHARKLGWDVYLIVQNIMMLDKQLRDALIEYQCRCIRLDKVKIPIIGSWLGLINRRLSYMPRIHMVAARVGYAGNQIVAQRWHFRGDDLHRAYDTRQIFIDDPAAAPYTTLHAYRFTPRAPSLSFKQLLLKWLRPITRNKTLKPPHPFIQILKDSPHLTDDAKLRIASRFFRLHPHAGSQGEGL